jgi:hypothetical protein
MGDESPPLRRLSHAVPASSTVNGLGLRAGINDMTLVFRSHCRAQRSTWIR